MEINLVLNYGRVGSIGITEALNSADCGPVLHIHKAEQRLITPEILRSLLGGEEVAQDLLWASVCNAFKQSQVLLNVICPVREPLARDISTATYGKSEPDAFLASPEFVSSFLERDISFATNWILAHLLPFTEIDILSQPFDKEAGYQIYKKNNVRLLMLQTELSNEAKGAALQDLLKLHKPPVLQSKVNTSGYSEQILPGIGSRLLERVGGSIPVDRLLATHFYNREDIQSSVGKFGLTIDQLRLPQLL